MQYFSRLLSSAVLQLFCFCNTVHIWQTAYWHIIIDVVQKNLPPVYCNKNTVYFWANLCEQGGIYPDQAGCLMHCTPYTPFTTDCNALYIVQCTMRFIPYIVGPALISLLASLAGPDKAQCTLVVNWKDCCILRALLSADSTNTQTGHTLCAHYWVRTLCTQYWTYCVHCAHNTMFAYCTVHSAKHFKFHTANSV